MPPIHAYERSQSLLSFFKCQAQVPTTIMMTTTRVTTQQLGENGEKLERKNPKTNK